MPVVALESTVIAHGLPYPHNLETARALEDLIREKGARPATIGVIGGEIRVGLAREELERLARGEGVRKVSLRDLPLVVSQGLDGATTVAATMHVAHRAGIRVFATGGIGGVHRPVGSYQPLDVSADLPALAHTPVAVVSSGAKAILDLPRTLEWLETYGVPVLGYGTDRFPAFYYGDSGLPVDCRVDCAEEAARIIKTKWEIGLPGGLLIAVPVPTEAEVPAEIVEEAVERALAVAEEQGMAGQALTPFLLAQINRITKGASLRANMALLKNNALVAARIAKALADLEGP